jgi:hypothetical protein
MAREGEDVLTSEWQDMELGEPARLDSMHTVRVEFRVAPEWPEPTEPGWYMCQKKCGYLYRKDVEGTWWRYWDKEYGTFSETTWEQIDDSDCVRSLKPVFP